MLRLVKRLLGASLVLLVGLLLPGVAAAGYFCQPAAPGCTICYNFSPDGESQGWIQVCQ